MPPNYKNLDPVDTTAAVYLGPAARDGAEVGWLIVCGGAECLKMHCVWLGIMFGAT